MALELGWVPDEWRDSFWRDDPAVDWAGMDDAARDAYDLDGDGSHLKIHQGQSPTLIRFRALTAEEVATIKGKSLKQSQTADEDYSPFLRVLYWAFRVGCEFPDVPQAKKVRVHGMLCLPNENSEKGKAGFVESVNRRYPGLVEFYGLRVWSASTLTEAQKSVNRSEGADSG